MRTLFRSLHLRRLTIAMAALIAVAAIAAPASAVRYGEADAGEHPYVGLLVFYDGNAPVPPPDQDTPGNALWRCTGTLISPTLVVTAGHCTEAGGAAQFFLQESINVALNVNVPGYPYSGGLLGKAYSGPNWQGGLYLPDTGDIGVVVLDEPVDLEDWNIDEADLPQLAPGGYLDALAKQRGKQDTSFEVVGYGLQGVKPDYLNAKTRNKATVQLVNLKSSLTDGFNIQTTNAKGKGTGGGGTCFGDSGGAIFHLGADDDGNQVHYIVAVNSFVLNENCAGASFGYRTDRTEVIEWILGSHN